MLYRRILSTLLLFTLLTLPLIAQQTTLQLGDAAALSLDGDSYVRSWGADAETVTGTLTLRNSGDLLLETLTPESFGSLELAVAVDSLDSGTRGLNKNMYDYLESKQHPAITFYLREVIGVEISNGKLSVHAKGVVNAAGQDHEILMNVLTEVVSPTAIRFTGEQEMLMSDFGIDPPTAVFGTVRSADEIVIRFDVTFSN